MGSPENIVIGLVTHLTPSALFGMGFVLLVPLLSGPRAVVLGAAAFGVALYVINFQILGRLFLEWFQEGPNQLFELSSTRLRAAARTVFTGVSGRAVG